MADSAGNVSGFEPGRSLRNALVGVAVAVAFVGAMAACVAMFGGRISGFGSSQWASLAGFGVAAGALFAASLNLRDHGGSLFFLALTAMSVTGGTYMAYLMAASSLR